MTAIITNLSKIQRAIDFVEKATISSSPTNTLYLGIGRETSWDTIVVDENGNDEGGILYSDTNPPTPSDSKREITELKFIKRIDKSVEGKCKLIKNGGRVVLKVATGTSYSEGDTITGSTSGTTGIVSYVETNVDEGGLDYIHVLVYEGQFTIGENLIENNETISDKDENFHTTFIFRNTVWEEVIIDTTAPITPNKYDYWWDKLNNQLKKYDGSAWVVDNSVFPKYCYIEAKLNAGEGVPGTYSFRQIGVLENPRNSNGLIDTVTEISENIVSQGILHYINFIEPITRNSNQNEILSIIIEF